MKHVIWALILTISLIINWNQFQTSKKLNKDLESCNKVKVNCEKMYSEEIKNFNEKQIQASSTIKKLQDKSLSNPSFEDCLNMRVPDSFARVFYGKDSSDKNRKTSN